MIRLGSVLACLLVGLVAVGRAHAAIAVLLPAEGRGVHESLRAEAYEAVREALVGAGRAPLSSADAQAKLRSSELCVDLDCAGSVLSALGADMLVTVALEPDGAGGAREALVTLVDPEDRHVNGSAPVSGDVAAAARAAFHRALAKWDARAGVALRVEGSPPGATVSIDGSAAGVLPLEQLVSPGRHRITVERQGYRPEARDVDVPGNAERPVLVKITLGGSRAALRPHAADYVIGGLLMAGGAFLATYSPVRTALEEGECRDGCDRVVKLQAGPTVGYALGGAATLALGAVWTWWLKPVAVAVDSRRGSAVLTVQARF